VVVNVATRHSGVLPEGKLPSISAAITDESSQIRSTIRWKREIPEEIQKSPAHNCFLILIDGPLSPSAYSGEDDRRFRANVTGDSAGSALL
jgi:hypothetical protein